MHQRHFKTFYQDEEVKNSVHSTAPQKKTGSATDISLDRIK